MSSATRAPIPLERLRGNGSFSRDARFSPLFGAASQQSDTAAKAERDPLAEAYARGLAEGRAAAEADAARLAAEREAQRAAIELSFARFDEAGAVDLRERLRQTVHALCEEAVLPLALDPAGLAARIEKAAAMLQRVQDERRVLLHPEDLALVETRLPAGLTVVPDPSVERGGLRIETEDGGIEDGPTQWRRILAEAFREC